MRKLMRKKSNMTLMVLFAFLTFAFVVACGEDTDTGGQVGQEQQQPGGQDARGYYENDRDRAAPPDRDQPTGYQQDQQAPRDGGGTGMDDDTRPGDRVPQRGGGSN
jgi:hypothetical protein